MIERVLLYGVLTDTESICVFFIFICKPESDLPDAKFRDVLFEVICANEILQRFDTSLEFWERYFVKNASLKKKQGYFSIENINYPCMKTVAVNPKEHIETFKSEHVNKKYKGLRKGAPGMEFENYSRRTNSIADTKSFGQLSVEKQKQNRFTIKNNEMILQEIEKSKFAQMNYKRYYFSSGILSLPFSHPYLHEIVQFKQNKKLNHFYRRKNTNLSSCKSLQ